ncbi:MAG: hypothetical protein AB8G15_19990 [Saprospiraceae bacterium]
MIDVLFFLDFEEGHIFPTYKVAQNLTEAGYKVAYMGVPYAMDIVAKQGF